MGLSDENGATLRDFRNLKAKSLCVSREMRTFAARLFLSSSAEIFH